MTCRLLMLVCAFSIASCGNDTGPNALDMNGVYAGTYTVSNHPQLVYQGALQIFQTGDSVRGTTNITSGRTANLYGVVLGRFVVMRLAINDICGGSGTSSAQITYGGHRLSGKYSVSGGCSPEFSGSYSLTKQ